MDRQNCVRMISEIDDIHVEYDDLRSKALTNRNLSAREIADAILEITEGEVRALRRVSDKCGASCTLASMRKPVAISVTEDTPTFWSTSTWVEAACKVDTITGNCVVPYGNTGEDSMVTRILAEAAQTRRNDETGMRWSSQ